MIVTQKMLAGTTVKDLPVQIVQRMLDIRNQLQKKCADPFKIIPAGWFDWSESPEGEEFWNMVLVDGSHSTFFARYPPVKNSDLVGEVSGFPIEVVQRMCEYQSIQNRPYNVKAFQHRKSCVEAGFAWDDTEEGFSFWQYVISRGKFEKFFELRDRAPEPTYVADPVFPAVMEVSHYPDFSNSRTGVVVFKNKDRGGPYCTFLEEHIDHISGGSVVMFFNYARPLPIHELTIAEIEEKLSIPLGTLKIKP